MDRNNCNVSKAELMREIMAVNFAMTDLVQYLDTHPDDADAIDLYNNLVRKFGTMLESYQSIFGPLIVQQYDGSTENWNWIDNPWPWNKEV